ncbi:hypothetical protein RHGRI_026050 [Rhododendron griersonianum]|uniref:Uncharacterized protein n=1 Tax=Rhododendron griersonianum TaxID=479676 RepID=A0AAV6IWG5_9ERIC|nr:hypothetical protein RHGRI_026050 [Rhododendron griersonianum]
MLKCAKMDHSQLVKLVRKMKKELQQMEPSSQVLVSYRWPYLVFMVSYELF